VEGVISNSHSYSDFLIVKFALTQIGAKQTDHGWFEKMPVSVSFRWEKKCGKLK
jgi:hypothetical protein